MLQFDLENEKETIRNYRRRIRLADELNWIAARIRNIVVQEQDHLIALATALGIDAPNPDIATDEPMEGMQNSAGRQRVSV